VEIFKEFSFEAAHHLPHVPPSHPCARVHGHSFTLRVSVRGSLDQQAGWVVDFADIIDAAAPMLAELDHHDLNGIPGLENPTTELLAKWIWKRLKPTLAGLSRIEVRETSSTGCVCDGTDV
jgi:6-pyruvoyltetrahydropterin/6-carboxytetrahydropterin synthase